MQCPRCNQPLQADASACPQCGASVNPDPAWAPTQSLVSADTTAQDAGPVSESGKVFLAGLALALGFADVARFVTQPAWVRWTEGDPAARLFQPWQLQALLVLAKYVLPAIAIYALLRLARAQRWLRATEGMHVLLWFGNVLFILYTVPRVAAMAIPGGGAAYTLAILSPFFIVPAYALCVAALLWLVVRSLLRRGQPGGPLPWTGREGVAAMLVVLCVAGSLVPLFIGAGAPYQVARAWEREFMARCDAAGERLVSPASAPARGLFVERNASAHYGEIRKGSYRWRSTGALGQPLVDSGYLLFVEMPARQPGAGALPYTRHHANDRQGAPVGEIESEYGVFHRELTSAEERKRGLDGFEVSIRDLKTSTTVATTTYFAHTKLGRFCGDAPNGSYREDLWLTRVLGLRARTYPPEVPARN
jgi:hypothetical protein